jgi:hypothetical protein
MRSCVTASDSDAVSSCKAACALVPLRAIATQSPFTARYEERLSVSRAPTPDHYAGRGNILPVLSREAPSLLPVAFAEHPRAERRGLADGYPWPVVARRMPFPTSSSRCSLGRRVPFPTKQHRPGALPGSHATRRLLRAKNKTALAGPLFI